MLITDTGEPLAPRYAATLAAVLGYEKTPGPKLVWLPVRGLAQIKAKTLYQPHIEATSSEMAVANGTSHLRLYLSAEPIHCRMLGEPWDDDWLIGLGEVWKGLPYSPAAVHAIIMQADWLDDHPEYRGLPGVANRERETPAQSAAESAPASLRGMNALGE